MVCISQSHAFDFFSIRSPTHLTFVSIPYILIGGLGGCLGSHGSNQIFVVLPSPISRRTPFFTKSQLPSSNDLQTKDRILPVCLPNIAMLNFSRSQKPRPPFLLGISIRFQATQCIGLAPLPLLH